MKLNDILLNHDQLGSLYKDLLVQTEAPQGAVANVATTDSNQVLPPLKGKFRKKILWLVYEEEHPFLSEPDFQFLSQILVACRMNLDDIYLCNCHNLTGSPEQLAEQLGAVVVLASGLTDAWAPATETYQAVQRNNQTICQTDALQLIQADKNLKAKLWTSLKQILQL